MDTNMETNCNTLNENTRDAQLFKLTEADCCYLINKALDDFFILFPFNARKKAQEKFIKELKKIKGA